MMVMNTRYGKFILIQVEASFPNAHFGLEQVGKPSHYVTSFLYEIDILIE